MEARVESEGGGVLPTWQQLRQSQVTDQPGQRSQFFHEQMFNSMRRPKSSGRAVARKFTGRGKGRNGHVRGRPFHSALQVLLRFSCGASGVFAALQVRLRRFRLQPLQIVAHLVVYILESTVIMMSCEPNLN